MLGGLLLTMRPRQWVKNVLVGAAPLAAGTIVHAEVAARTALAFAAFCLASSAVYCVNDVFDAEADRLHERKRHRPVAAGRVSDRAAVATAVVLAAAALAIGTPNSLRGVLAAYLVLSIGYCVWLKREPVIEMALVSSGFLLRSVAGGPATGIPLSRWFLIVAGFGSLFIVVAKRLSEMTLLGSETQTRPMLAAYTKSYLELVLGIAGAVTVAGYGLWAFEVGAGKASSIWAAISVAPFVIALLRYALHIDSGRAEDPEHILLTDHVLQALIVAWAATFSVSALHG